MFISTNVNYYEISRIILFKDKIIHSPFYYYNIIVLILQSEVSETYIPKFFIIQ